MAAIAVAAATGMPKNSSRKTRSSAAPAGSGNASGLRRDDSIAMVGIRAARTVVTAAPATIAQTTGRHRGDGGWPSGNSTGSSSSTKMAGTQARLLTQPIRPRPGTVPGASTP
jgi:hypothetical protein